MHSDLLRPGVNLSIAAYDVGDYTVHIVVLGSALSSEQICQVERFHSLWAGLGS